jgi:hypothetical protein
MHIHCWLVYFLHYYVFCILHYCAFYFLHYCVFCILHYCAFYILHYCAFYILHYCAFYILQLRASLCIDKYHFLDLCGLCNMKKQIVKPIIVTLWLTHLFLISHVASHHQFLIRYFQPKMDFFYRAFFFFAYILINSSKNRIIKLYCSGRRACTLLFSCRCGTAC